MEGRRGSGNEVGRISQRGKRHHLSHETRIAFSRLGFSSLRWN
jgi:hypothetical protein